MEIEDCMVCSVCKEPTISYIFDSGKKTISFYVEPHLDMSKVTMREAVVTKKVSEDEKGYDVDVYCPVCAKPSNCYTGIPHDWKVESGPDRTLVLIPFAEFPKGCIVAMSEGEAK